MSARILLIEDNPANSELMRYLLKAHGYETVAAWSGEAGLELVSEQQFDIVLCDIQLPGIDGMTVARRLKSLEIGKRLPVLAVTALAMVGDRDRILSAGFDGYLSKPLDPRTFVAKIEAHIPARLREAPRTPDASPSTTALGQEQEPEATVLLVDDEPTNLQVLRGTLEPFGYRVLEAKNSQEAWACVRRERPDLILSDLHLGGEEPFGLLEEIKNDEELRTIPFVLLSSTSEKQSLAERARAMGATTFLFRPIDPGTLLSEIRTALGNS